MTASCMTKASTLGRKQPSKGMGGNSHRGVAGAVASASPREHDVDSNSPIFSTSIRQSGWKPRHAALSSSRETNPSLGGRGVWQNQMALRGQTSGKRLLLEA